MINMNDRKPNYTIQYRAEGMWFEYNHRPTTDPDLAKQLEQELKATFETRIVKEA